MEVYLVRVEGEGSFGSGREGYAVVVLILVGSGLLERA